MKKSSRILQNTIILLFLFPTFLDAQHLSYKKIASCVKQQLSRYGYTRQEKDFELGEKKGILNYRARIYDAKLRMLLSPDPDKDTREWYKYVNGNPVSFTDPTGRNGEDYTKIFSGDFSNSSTSSFTTPSQSTDLNALTCPLGQKCEYLMSITNPKFSANEGIVVGATFSSSPTDEIRTSYTSTVLGYTGGKWSDWSTNWKNNLSLENKFIASAGNESFSGVSNGGIKGGGQAQMFANSILGRVNSTVYTKATGRNYGDVNKEYISSQEGTILYKGFGGEKKDPWSITHQMNNGKQLDATTKRIKENNLSIKACRKNPETKKFDICAPITPSISNLWKQDF